MKDHLHLNIKDNQSDCLISQLSSEPLNEDDYKKVIEDIAQISTTKLSDNANLLVFPQCIGVYGDGIEKGTICSLNKEERKISTGNLMGFVGTGSTELTISSRFSKERGKDYFLHYMLQKVFCINMFKWKHSYDEQNVLDILLYLFPYYLNKALTQGLFKEYRRFEHNDSKVKGTIDINRHIQRNIPFLGSFAYNTKEYSFDNRVTQLIRHTIEYISKHDMGKNVLRETDTQQNVRLIIDSTPTYSRNNLQKVISENLKDLYHPFFTEYTVLQKICLQILRHEGLKYGDDKREVYGILFDGAWLWEEYLNTLLKDNGFIHPRNKEGKDPIWLFDSERDDDGLISTRKHCKRFPDFYMKASSVNNNDAVILDAKYKRLESGYIDRDDMHQIISYIHVERAKLGGLIYPFSCEDSEQLDLKEKKIGRLRGHGGEVWIYGLPIPGNIHGMQFFVEKMANIESNFIPTLRNRLNLIQN